MKYIKTLLFSFLIISTLKILSQTIPIPELKEPVTDLTGTLELFEIDLLQQKLLDFQNNNGSQIVIVIISTTGDESIEDYSMRLAENWKIGSAENDDGIILLVAKNDRTLRIEVGYGLEEKVTDAEAGFIINNIIVPEFKNGNFYSGINSGIDYLFGLINGEIIFDKNTLSDSNTVSESSENSDFSGWFAFFIIFLTMIQIIPFFMTNSKLYVFLIVLAAIFGTDYISGIITDDSDMALGYMIVTGMLSLIPFLVNLITSITGKKTKTGEFWSGGSSSGGSWSSSSSSSSWGSSGSSSFSGGGGSFGGGGASGSW